MGGLALTSLATDAKQVAPGRSYVPHRMKTKPFGYLLRDLAGKTCTRRLCWRLEYWKSCLSLFGSTFGHLAFHALALAQSDRLFSGPESTKKCLLGKPHNIEIFFRKMTFVRSPVSGYTCKGVE